MTKDFFSVTASMIRITFVTFIGKTKHKKKYTLLKFGFAGIKRLKTTATDIIERTV